MTTHPPAELHRPLLAVRVVAAPVSMTVKAEPAERAAIALRLGIAAVKSLECAFVLRRRDDLPGGKARGQIVAEGVLRARVVQDCVVSLEPFEAAIAETFRIHLVPAGTETEDPDPESDDEVPYDGDTIDLGEAAVEQLALALDPYPRKPGAALPEDYAEGPTSPFAALARRTRDN